MEYASRRGVLAVCGWSGSGKTTVLEAIVPRLRSKGLRVAVVKHDVHGLEVDRPGKDSDLLFRAGADVLLHGDDERLLRSHPTAHDSLDADLRQLLRDHDLVLVEGHKGTPLPKVWALAEGEASPPDGVEGILATLGRDEDRAARLEALIDDWLPRTWAETPLRAGVLIGGDSRRMGHPKHLLREGGETWLERTTRVLADVTGSVVVLGGGELPERFEIPRLPDPRGVRGPLAGILGAMRSDPDASWLIAACDLPDLSGDALRWLLSTRAPGVWATLPRLEPDGPAEPVLAHYDPRARPLLEALAVREKRSLQGLAGHPEVITPAPPAALAGAWRDVNEPDPPRGAT